MDTTKTMPMRAVVARRPIWSGMPRLLKVTTLWVVILATLPIVLIVGTYIYYQASGIILPGVKVGGVPLHGLTEFEAVTEIERVWNKDYRITAVDINALGRSWVVAPSDFGLRIDASINAAEAYNVGRGRGVLVGMKDLILTWWEGHEITPKVTFDPFEARIGLEVWATQVNVPVMDGRVMVEGGEAVGIPGQVGKTLDVESSLALLSTDPTAVMLEYRFVPLVMDLVEPSIGDVSVTAAEVERILRELTIRAYDPVTDEHYEWVPSREEIASWLRIERDDDELRVEIEDDKVTVYLVELERSLGDQRFFDHDEGLAAVKAILQNGEVDIFRVKYHPTSYVVQATDSMVTISFKMGMPYWKIHEANPSVAARGLVVGETIVAPPADAMLTLPVVENKRIVISITQQRMWVYQDGELFREHIVSTGMSGSPTLPGIFQVQWHYINAYGSRWDLWMPHFLGIYEAAPGFINGIHGLPLLSNGVRLWGDVLGRPASYGCIILTLDAAEELYYWAESGVVVEIQS
ncbi:MAG TPA: L,D-transpeptidase family protein [Anaerolineae bacterium]|nr:L,D-transpeptidase family protein [Anaerolineae bacterium]